MAHHTQERRCREIDTRARCWLLTLFLAAPVGAALTNGDFEAGIGRWSTKQSWYEKPKGAGLSEAAVVDGEGRGGSKALKIVGGGKRGIAMQVFPAYPGRYRVSGWIKCEGLDAGHAQILVEWMDRQNTWMSGEGPGTISGTKDWTRFEKVVTAPAGTRSVHFDLLTSEPNNGTVWFDDVELERAPSGFAAPAPPTVRAETPAGREGCLEVTWDPGTFSEGVVRLLLYCEPKLPDHNAVPRVVIDSEEKEATIWSLTNGEMYQVAAVAVNVDGKASVMGPATSAIVADLQAPRAGWMEANALGGQRVQVSWWPHVLDLDVAKLHVGVETGAEGELKALQAVDAAPLYKEPRPLYCIEPWAKVEVSAPKDTTRLGVWCEDRAGNRGVVAWADVDRQAAGDASLPGAVWFVPPVAQLRRDAEPPSGQGEPPLLDLMRGQAKGFQVMVKPERELHGVRVRLGALVHEDGQSRIEPRWLAYHFVNYVNLEKNSRATPAEELLWKAPADFPDELSDDLTRDLPAAQVQPIYVRVSAPRRAKPGTYRGTATLECVEGRQQFEIAAQVRPVDLPERPRLKFVYWFSWDAPCKALDVYEYSEDGWRVLSRLGELMRVHHQNVVVVPWSLVHTWRQGDGTLAHDFRDFDRFIRTFQTERVDSMFCLSHMGSRSTGEWTCPTMRSHGYRLRRVDTGEEEQINVLDVLPAIEQHIDELGLVDRFAVHVADEPIPQNLASYRELSAKVKQAAPRLRRIDAVHVPNLDGALEIWVPQLNYFEKSLDQFKAAQESGNEIWFYVAWVPQGKFPNRMIDSAAIKSRVLHWLNGIYDTSGYLHWALNHWHISLMSLVSPGDQYICWPSQRYVANSSLRYEAEREGLEDCELMFLLRDALRGQGLTREEAQTRVEAIAREAVRSPQDYTRSWAELEGVRKRLLDELERAG